jgi:hypothetical protein
MLVAINLVATKTCSSYIAIMVFSYERKESTAFGRELMLAMSS